MSHEQESSHEHALLRGVELNWRWTRVRKETQFRHKVLSEVTGYLSAVDRKDGAFTLAATDVFVEKAQRMLTWRGVAVTCLGCGAGGLALALLAYTAYTIYCTPLTRLLDGEPLNWPAVFLVLIKASAAGGLVIAASLFLMHLSRALFHEASNMFHRRHALRFGRLYVYLRPAKIPFKELNEAFQWHEEFSSAFRDMKIGEVSPKTSLQSLQDSVDRVARNVAGVSGRLRSHFRRQGATGNAP